MPAPRYGAALRPRRVVRPARAFLLSANLGILAFLLLHIPLAFLLHYSPIFATVHALGTVMVGISFLSRDRHPFRLLYVVAYIVGAELLWRATDSYVFYEFGKYATSLLLIFAILKFNMLKRVDARGPLYFALLLPSLSQVEAFDRQQIAFNLSGPFALAVAVTFFSALQLPRTEIRRLCFAILGPIVSLVTLSTFSTLTYMPGVFIIGSKLTSGGVGPNQMSSMLGLGALLAFLCLFIEKKSLSLRLTLLGCLLWFSGQCVMTFSRGGFWTALGSILIAALYLFSGRRLRGAILAMGTLIYLVFNFLIFPALDNYTGGLLGERFSDFDPSGRDRIAEADLILFEEHPVLGVGPGESKTLHEITFGVASAHTEFSRLLAEHGSFGVMALLLLLSLAWQRFRAPLPPFEKACSMAFAAWALVFMLHAAMRLVAPAVLFGIGSATILGEPTPVRARRPRPFPRARAATAMRRPGLSGI
jgi:hypothetical protein